MAKAQQELEETKRLHILEPTEASHAYLDEIEADLPRQILLATIEAIFRQLEKGTLVAFGRRESELALSELPAAVWGRAFELAPDNKGVIFGGGLQLYDVEIDFPATGAGGAAVDRAGGDTMPAAVSGEMPASPDCGGKRYRQATRDQISAAIESVAGSEKDRKIPGINALWPKVRDKLEAQGLTSKRETVGTVRKTDGFSSSKRQRGQKVS